MLAKFSRATRTMFFLSFPSHKNFYRRASHNNFISMQILGEVPNLQSDSKKTGIMEFCIFGIQKCGYTLKVTVSNTYLIKSTQLAIIRLLQLPERFHLRKWWSFRIFIKRLIRMIILIMYLSHPFVNDIQMSNILN